MFVGGSLKVKVEKMLVGIQAMAGWVS